MSWFFIALAAPFLWALVNISDQYLVGRYAVGKRGSGGLVLFSSLVGIFVAIGIGLFVPHLFSISRLDIFLLLVAGAITAFWVILYLYALEIEEVSSVVPWFLTIPVFGYGLGYIFLGETLTREQLLGAFIILIGVFLISIDFSGPKKKIKWVPAAYMLGACFLIAVAGVLFKYVTIVGDFWVSSFWEYVGLGISGLFLYICIPKYRKEFHLMNQTGGWKIFALNAASEVTTIIGNMLTNYAFLLAPVTMVYLVSSFQPAIVLFLSIILTELAPGLIMHEDLKERVLLPKVIAIALMIAGSIILFL